MVAPYLRLSLNLQSCHQKTLTKRHASRVLEATLRIFGSLDAKTLSAYSHVLLSAVTSATCNGNRDERSEGLLRSQYRPEASRFLSLFRGIAVVLSLIAVGRRVNLEAVH